MINKQPLLLIFLILLSLTFNSKAEKVHWTKQPGAENLPPFCGASKNPKFAGINWKKKIGSDVVWLNHYCKNKIHEFNCFIQQGRGKEKCIAKLTKEYSYSINHAKDPNYKLLPFLHTELAIVRAEIGDNAGALEHFNIAMKKNPKYMKVYVKMAKLYIKLKNYKDASVLVEKGLSIKKHRTLLKLKKQLETLSK